jgi:hypothetical protein
MTIRRIAARPESNSHGPVDLEDGRALRAPHVPAPPLGHEQFRTDECGIGARYP